MVGWSPDGTPTFQVFFAISPDDAAQHRDPTKQTVTVTLQKTITPRGTSCRGCPETVNWVSDWYPKRESKKSNRVPQKLKRISKVTNP